MKEFHPDVVAPTTSNEYALGAVVATRSDLHKLAMHLRETVREPWVTRELPPEDPDKLAAHPFWGPLSRILAALDYRLVNSPVGGKNEIASRNTMGEQGRRWTALYIAMADDLNINA